ncbi:MAG: 6-phosphofructokinase [Bacteroidales bacterium]|nr:6-phosphofructokinase [Bacteroidales bacterium]
MQKVNLNSPIKTIGVMTSGGDSPGMNAAIRAVVRASLYYNRRIFGIYHGYEGLINGQIQELFSSDVSDVITRGGTFLRTSRCLRFFDYEGRKEAHKQLKKHKIDAVVVIGGDGSFKGAKEFADEFDFPVIGIPGTIDNDMYGTDYTIGYDTALNTVVRAVDKIRDTASSHDRLFFVEVMGRDAGFIALRSGIAAGAEEILIPERRTDFRKLKQYLQDEYRVKKSSSIVLVAEGDDSGGALVLANTIHRDFPDFNVRISILGHVQRGGSPSAFDRVMASQMGIAAVQGFLNGKKSMMVGMRNRKMVFVNLEKTGKHTKKVKQSLLDMIKILNV